VGILIEFLSFVRLMYNITEDDRKFAELVKADKETLEKNFENALEKVEHTLNLFAEPIILSQEFGLDKNKTFWNIARYISIVSLDLKILAKHQAFSVNEWEKRFFARQIALLIYESVDDLLVFLGKPFIKIAVDFRQDQGFTIRLNEVRKSLNIFKEKNSKRLQSIRNTSLAHRDKDTSLQLKTIYSISWVEFVNLCSEFDGIINQVGEFLETLMRKGINDGVIKFNAY
jgi:hypothetical protein